MPSRLPTPVAAAIGVVPAVLGHVRRLPGRAVQLPVLAVSGALSGMDAFRREYDDLADRGEALVARLRGQAASAAEQVPDVIDLTDQTPFAPTPDPDDAVDPAPAVLRAVPSTGGPEAPKGGPTPRATEPDATRLDTAASPTVQQTVEQAVEGVAAAGVDATVGHDELPLPDYDHMTLGSLRGRLRALTLDQLVQIRSYEKSHADRLPVVTMLDNRIAKLATDDSAGPSGPVSTAPAPEQQAAASGPASTISPATTSAPPVNPPSQGDPTNPAQPR